MTSTAVEQTVRPGSRASEIQVVGRTDGAVRPIAVPQGVTKGMFFLVVATYDAAFRSKGSLPTVNDVLKMQPNLKKSIISTVIATEEFAEAMELRGVGFSATDGLSPQQLAVLNVLENFSDGRSLTAKLKDAGVTRTQFNGWLKDPLFRQLYEHRVESHLKDAHLPALTTLMSAAENGDTRAAEKILEINGRYNPQNAELQNARVVVQALVEALQKYAPADVVEKVIAEVSMAQQVARITA